MRKNEKEFQMFIRKYIMEYRKCNYLSQEKMAEILHVSLRSYAGQERGEYGFSAQSLMCFIYKLTETERASFIEAFEKHLENIEREIIA